ncbi:callose synthase [Thraustotheca clavata]|uniref:1,3-beta-glucan synthase n=1 Tax=Thraustotheca clavata TaxID=74557 RepID=A0A1W0A4R3_9STRA|nr:callose synthase [Thraustotheca clavata]
MSTGPGTLDVQKSLYDEAMVHVNAGVAAQSEGKDAEQEFTQAVEIMERALALTFTYEEKETSKRLANKMARYVNMIKSQRGKATDAIKESTARYNILDMENLPERYDAITKALTTSPTHGDVFESLKNTFGFQENNVKNQKEHVMLLLTNYKEQIETPLATPLESAKKSKKPVVAPPLPADVTEAMKQAIDKLHNRLFDNYIKWCKYLKVTPAFTKEPIVDIVLFFLMWGEAGNFRQTPELLCFLFHNSLPAAAPTTTPKEPGTFLATIIRPIYAEVKKDNDKKTPLGQRAPHKEIRNYDDFNEFFWTKKCLKFDATNIATALGSVDKNGKPKDAPKTFIETRSWMRALWSFRRIFLFNLCLFCATVGFAVDMILLCPVSPIMYGPDLGKEATILGKLYYKAKPRYEMNNDLDVDTCNMPKLATCLGVVNYVPYVTFQYLPEDMKMLMADIPFQPCLEILGGRCSCYHDTLDDCFTQAGTAIMYDPTDPTQMSTVKYNQATCMPSYRKAAMNVINNAGDGMLNCGQCTVATADIPTKLPALLMGLVDLNRKDMGPLIFGGGLAIFALFVFGELINRLFSGMLIGYVGRNLPVPWTAYCRYTCFWLFMFTVKLSFDYNFMVKNLVETSLMIWLSDPTQYLQVSQFMIQKSYHNIIYIIFLWLPAVVVFFYDCQIFYAMFSVVFGSIRGFNLRIGELRSFRILRQAFKSIPKMFNKKLVPNAVEVEVSKKKAEDKKKKKSQKDIEAEEEKALEIKAQLYQGASSTAASLHAGSNRSFGQVSGIDGSEFERVFPFAAAWNRCLVSMRAADVINNRELNVLSYLIDGDDSMASSERRLYPPAFLTAGKLDESLDIITDCAAVYEKLKSDKKKDAALAKVETSMRDRLKKDDLRIEACLGSYKFTVRILRQLLGDAHAELDPCYAFIEEAVHTHEILKGLNVSGVHALRTAAAVTMKAIIDIPKGAKADNLTFQRALYRVIDSTEQLLVQLKKVLSKQEALAKVINDTPLKPNSFFIASDSTHEYATKQIQSIIDDVPTMAIVSRAYQLLTVDNFDAEPRSDEGQRRLRFFSNSLFMEMPDAQSVKRMHSLSIATPYYSEIVLYSVKELTEKNAKDEDSIQLLYYLQTVYTVEWQNFLERLGVNNEKEALAKSPEEVQLWASYRGQTLARTIRGMMYNEEAIRFLYWLELGHNAASDALNKELDEMVALKFNYVVTCQIYGKQKEEDKQQARDIDYLLKKHRSLRVAYVDGPKRMKDGPPKFFSCLVRSSQDKIVEVYRIELPGDPVIGEGKPENQNHAVVFSRGELLQCVDMNQDGYFEECLKMPNLLATVDRPEHKNSPLTIIGFREYVFTGGVSNLASFMQIQELSFVSLGQRMLAYNYVRQHYGHPDIFDKMFAMSTGGTAKASRGINLSEDIFAGFNSTLRGGRVSHEEFIQVGKGRDVGMQQLALFEAKLSSGAGECVTSRDVMRMANRLDFFRLNSWFYGNLGWYFTQTMTVFGVYFFIYGKIYFALSGMDAFYLQLGRLGISGVLNTSWALQFGFLLVVPVIGVIGVERGFRHGVTFLLWNVMTLGPLFFTFQMGNRMHYFDRTLIHGGAKYRATGRGFTIKHEKFAELYRFYAFSHFYRGVELMFLLVLFAIYGTFNWCNCSWQQDITFYNGVEPLPYEWQQRCYSNWYQQCVLPTNQNYGIMSYSLWIIAATWVWSPFVFNPSAFDWDLLIAGYRDWQNWLQTKNDSAESWYGWWTAELDFLQYSTGFSRFVTFVRKTRFLLVAFGIYLQLMYRLVYKDRHTTVATGNPILPYILCGAIFVFLILFACIAYIASRVTKKMTLKQRKLRKLKFNLGWLLLFIVLGSLMYLSISNFAEIMVILALVAYWFLQLMICCLKEQHVVIINIAKSFDVVIGWIVFGPILFIAMFMPFLAALQQRIMFNSAFTSGLEVNKLLGNKVVSETSPIQPQPTNEPAKPKVKATKKKKPDEAANTHYGTM